MSVSLRRVAPVDLGVIPWLFSSPQRPSACLGAPCHILDTCRCRVRTVCDSVGVVLFCTPCRVLALGPLGTSWRGFSFGFHWPFPHTFHTGICFLWEVRVCKFRTVRFPLPSGIFLCGGVVCIPLACDAGIGLLSRLLGCEPEFPLDPGRYGLLTLPGTKV